MKSGLDYKAQVLIGNKIYCIPITIAEFRNYFLSTAKGNYYENPNTEKADFKRFSENMIPQKKFTPTMVVSSFLCVPFNDLPSSPIGSSS